VLARAKRDYYAVLGVAPDADQSAIKRAFRALAAELHPDVSDEPDAAERFREVAEAYDTLSRADARARYDRQRARTAPPGRTAPGAVRRDMGRGRTGPRPGQRGADVEVDAEIDFGEAARGTTRSLRFPSVDLCPDCLGVGRLGPSPCRRCGARGIVRVERSLEARIPAGTADGQEIRLAGEGQPGGAGAPAGDVVVRVRVRKAPDNPLVRRLAAAGVGCAVALAVVVAILSS
jgi:DnaJ-class molecular chaperone